METQNKPAKTAKGKNIKHTISVFFIGLIIGALACGAVIYYIFAMTSKEVVTSDVETLSPTVVFSRVQDQGELVSASQDYTYVDKVTDSNRDLFNQFDVPFTENSFWYRYSGTLKAGVNLKTAAIEQDSEDSTVLNITLDQPYIVSNTPNMDLSGVLEENNNLINPISIQESDAFQKECIERSEQEAMNGGLLEEARTNAEKQITNLYNAAFDEGKYTINFIYRDADSTSNQ
ncbi:DUF4230 domain-containing protein [Olsenella sp. AGMB03486]|jgi:hypothetical protein|uniref:DUF4230 domain-containing protein n=1 Tax=Olsenella sp. AGMB03486 TaxID=3230364 RepID=UPI0034A0560A